MEEIAVDLRVDGLHLAVLDKLLLWVRRLLSFHGLFELIFIRSH